MEARRGLTKRWKRNRLNRKLKKLIANINVEIQTYASQLTRNNWYSICNQLNGNLHLKKAWSLIRYLIQPENSITELNKCLDILAANYNKVEDLLDELANVYFFPKRDYPAYKDYNGKANTCYLNQPITRAELTEAIAEANRHSPPGSHKIGNGILRNLNESDNEHLLQVMNKPWECGTLPQEWKDAVVAFIPKPSAGTT